MSTTREVAAEALTLLASCSGKTTGETIGHLAKLAPDSIAAGLALLHVNMRHLGSVFGPEPLKFVVTLIDRVDRGPAREPRRGGVTPTQLANEILHRHMEDLLEAESKKVDPAIGDMHKIYHKLAEAIEGAIVLAVTQAIDRIAREVKEDVDNAEYDD